WENTKKQDDMTKNLRVAPKPLVMVAGVWSDPNDFDIFQNILTISHSYDWKSCSIKEMATYGTIRQESSITESAANRSVYNLADNLANYVESTRRDSNAWHVDMLGHGTGGLVARLYVHKQMELAP